jgi:hypothetical protein
VTKRLPEPMETQSSPVEIIELVICTSSLCPTWTPSVLGLSPGATMVSCFTLTDLLAMITMCICGLFTLQKWLSCRLLHCTTLSAWYRMGIPS